MALASHSPFPVFENRTVLFFTLGCHGMPIRCKMHCSELLAVKTGQLGVYARIERLTFMVNKDDTLHVRCYFMYAKHLFVRKRRKAWKKMWAVICCANTDCNLRAWYRWPRKSYGPLSHSACGLLRGICNTMDKLCAISILILLRFGIQI